MLKGFRDFISRGNAIDLAVGVIIGAAFSAVVNSIVADIFMPVIGRIFGSPDFSSFVLFADSPDSGGLDIGQLITTVVNLFIIAFALYFFIVLPMNALLKKKKEVPPPPAATPADIQLLREIRDLLKERAGD